GDELRGDRRAPQNSSPFMGRWPNGPDGLESSSPFMGKWPKGPEGLQTPRQTASAVTDRGHRHHGPARHLRDPRLMLRVAAGEDMLIVDPRAREHAVADRAERMAAGALGDEGPTVGDEGHLGAVR